jgi:sigma-B regulation protein RsbU (phosphoserine phosphatase)
MDANGELFGKARLSEAVGRAAPATARDLIDAILAAVRAFIGDTPQADDLTIVTVKRSDERRAMRDE